MKKNLVLLAAFFIFSSLTSFGQTTIPGYTVQKIQTIDIMYSGSGVQGSVSYWTGFEANDDGDPMGLSIEDGDEINLSVSAAFGLLIIHGDGSVELSHGDEITLVEKRDLIDEGASTIQLQSVIRNGKFADPEVDDKENQIFIAEDEDGTVFLVTSDEKTKLSSAIDELSAVGFVRVLKVSNYQDRPGKGPARIGFTFAKKLLK